MPDTTVKTKIQLRRDTTANWLTNKDIVPAAGEPCFDYELGILKIGDGTTTYENLEAIGAGGVSSASHYEGVKGAEESDMDVINRVLEAAEATAKKDDIFIVKALISEGKYSYTAYVYNGSVWAAMDGNYSADNVYFPDNMVFTYAFGKYTPSGGKVSIPSAGLNMTGLFENAFSEDINPNITQPSVTLNAPEIKAYEVGTTVTPTYTATLNPGSYEYGPATGIVATSWSVTDGSQTLETASGSFSELTVGDDTNYSITATAQYGDGTVPETALGNQYTAGQIKAGSKSATKSKISGYRNGFYGTLTSKEGTINSAMVRGLATKTGKTPATGNVWNISVPIGALRVMFAYPANLPEVSSIQDVNGMNAEIKSSFTQTQVNVEGASGYTGVDYRVYYLDFANANDTQNTYKVTL